MKGKCIGFYSSVNKDTKAVKGYNLTFIQPIEYGGAGYSASMVYFSFDFVTHHNLVIDDSILNKIFAFETRRNNWGGYFATDLYSISE